MEVLTWVRLACAMWTSRRSCWPPNQLIRIVDGAGIASGDSVLPPLWLGRVPRSLEGREGRTGVGMPSDTSFCGDTSLSSSVMCVVSPFRLTAVAYCACMVHVEWLAQDSRHQPHLGNTHPR